MFKVGDRVRIKESVSQRDYDSIGIYGSYLQIHKTSDGTIENLFFGSVFVRFEDGSNGTWGIPRDFLKKVSFLEDFIRSLYV